MYYANKVTTLYLYMYAVLFSAFQEFGTRDNFSGNLVSLWTQGSANSLLNVSASAHVTSYLCTEFN